VSTAPWVPQSSSAGNSNPGSARPTPPTSRPVSRTQGKGTGAAEFPALPPAAKPQSTIFGYGRGMVRRDGVGGPATSAWGGGGANSGTSTPPIEESEEAGEGRGKRKGNKGKKQVLMNWG
jgi:hypothetical protein